MRKSGEIVEFPAGKSAGPDQRSDADRCLDCAQICALVATQIRHMRHVAAGLSNPFDGKFFADAASCAEHFEQLSDRFAGVAAASMHADPKGAA